MRSWGIRTPEPSTDTTLHQRGDARDPGATDLRGRNPRRARRGRRVVAPAARFRRLGLLSHQRVNSHGIANQVWKDSWDSMSHADGTVANHTAPVASLEAQAVAYDALVEVGELHAADRLARSVEKHFWLGDFYAIGVDRDPPTGAPRPLSTRASNMGWLLRSRLLDGREDRQRRIVELLFSDEFLAESGVRTLSNREVRFRSRSYHNGTVWPHDNYLISLGLEQRGFVDEAQELRRRLASFCRATHRFPEFVGGGEPGDAPFTKRIVDVYDTVNDRPNRVEQPPPLGDDRAVGTIKIPGGPSAVSCGASREAPLRPLQAR